MGFPFLPSGCQIVLDRQSQQTVLDNVRSQITDEVESDRQRAQDARRHGSRDVPRRVWDRAFGYLASRSHSWTRARRDAGLPTPSGSALEEQLLRRVRAFAHVDDRMRTQEYGRLLGGDGPRYSEMSPVEQRVSADALLLLWPDGGDHASIDDGLAALRREEATRESCGASSTSSFDAARHQAIELDRSLIDVPLRVHARYQREEVLAALGLRLDGTQANSFREGVLYVPDRNVDAMFVTLKKSEEEYSPTTMYRDYPISPTLFHWESQSVTSAASPTGQRYLTGTSTVLLFVRETRKDDFGTAPYLFLGPSTTSATRASGRSRSLGSSSTPCRSTSTTQQR